MSNQLAGRLIVRRVSDLHPRSENGHDAVLDHVAVRALFTTPSERLPCVNRRNLDAVAVNKTPCGHAIIARFHGCFIRIQSHT